MGSSAKRKKEKKKDFQKPKLKVGKTKPKASNHTSTSFQAKSIVLKQQSLSTSAPTVAAQFEHHLSLLTSKNDTQRRDSLAYLTTALASLPPGTALPQPGPTILAKVEPLLISISNGVRQQALKFIQELPAGDVRSRIEPLLLRTQAGLTNLAQDIRSSSLEILDWLLEVAGKELVSCPGGWTRTLDIFQGLLGVKSDPKSGAWTSTRTVKSGADKLYAKQLSTLSNLLRAGIVEVIALQSQMGNDLWFPLCQTEQHLLPLGSNPFGHLNLFGHRRNDKDQMLEDVQDRRRTFLEYAMPAVQAAIASAKGEGGEVGRAAAQLRKAVDDGMKKYEHQP
ncbi:hypothetical protein LTS18_003064 [Coniosporium uncinatum]|uniref:Uncharacterized protein n=1 Tax=Coniosporium uncinatum TaxID=93489 RepID=A0ACC3DTZ6_9PEZI|nr:hypothetical protein LTS18_003064 [Coniosporium uncinatum]